jgi:hypothetical protein
VVHEVRCSNMLGFVFRSTDEPRSFEVFQAVDAVMSESIFLAADKGGWVMDSRLAIAFSGVSVPSEENEQWTKKRNNLLKTAGRR